MKNMTKKQKKALKKIIAGAVVFFIAMIVSHLTPAPWYVNLALGIVAMLIVGVDVFLKAVKNLGKGQMLDENFLMTLAAVGAFFIGDYTEGVAVMLFYQIGELFQSCAVAKSRRSIADLMDIRPDSANVWREGEFVCVDPYEVKVEDVILVKPGEKIPLDGIVIDGKSSMDTSPLTGESLPRNIKEGEEALSGCVNLSGAIQVRVTKEFGESTVSKILDLVENASEKKSKSENFITKFARYYTPIVVGLAVALAIIPPLVMQDNIWEWVHRALIFLVISCPCALVISIPLSFFGGIGGASSKGVLIKGSNYLETLAKAEIVVMDKTGTLTKGTFEVTDIFPEACDRNELLEICAYGEYYSQHPISQSLKRAYSTINKNIIDTTRLKDVEEISGHGVKAVLDGEEILVGNDKLMEQFHIAYEPVSKIGTVVYVAKGNKYMGSILISDELKEDAAGAIADMKQCGVRRLVMLTGDRKEAGEQIAGKLGIDEVYTQLLPKDKVEQVERLLNEKSKDRALVFVGDGINDAPVLSRADVGIAMGGLGSDAAIEAADVVIMHDEPSKIPQAILVCRKTLHIVRQNIVFALGVKIIFLIMGALGVANMWEAVFADVGVSVIAILNAMRALR